MKIRNYANQDYFQVTSILKEVNLFDEVWDSEDNLKSMIEKDSNSILVAEINGKIVGNLLIVPYGGKVAYLFRLAVKKEFRQQGIATKLIKKAEEIIKQSGVLEFGLYVDSGNLSLHDFYKERGFKISPATYYYMWKEL